MEYPGKDNDLSDFGAEYIRAIGEELKCRICLLHLRDPQVANCSHSFCKQCIQKGFETMPKSKREKNSWSCPLCKAPFNRRAIKSDEVTNNLVTEFFNLARSFENLHQRNDMFSQEQPYEDSPKVVMPTDNKDVSLNNTTLNSFETSSRSATRNDSSSRTLVNSEYSGLKTNSELSEIGQGVPEATPLSSSKLEKQKTFNKESTNHDLSEGLPDVSSLFKATSPEITNRKSISPEDSTFKGESTQQKELADLLFPEDSSEEASASNLSVKPVAKKAYHKKETSVIHLRNSHASSGIGVIQTIRSKKPLKIPKKQKLNPEDQQYNILKTPNESHDYNRILDSSPLPSIHNSPNLSNLFSNTSFPNCVTDIKKIHNSQNINISKETSSNSSLVINPNFSEQNSPFYNASKSKASINEEGILTSQFKTKNSDFSYSSIELLRKEDTINSIELDESPSKINNIILDFSSESSPICIKIPNILNSNGGLRQESDLSTSSESNKFLFKKPNSNEFPNREDSTDLISETMNLEISKANYPPPNQLALFDNSWSQVEYNQSSRIFNDSKGLLDNISPTQVLNHTQPTRTQIYENTQPLLKEFAIDNHFSPSKTIETPVIDINLLPSRNSSDLTSDKSYGEAPLKFVGTPFSQTQLNLIKRPASFILDEELSDSPKNSQHGHSNSKHSKDHAYLDKVTLKDTVSGDKDFLGTPFFTPVQVRRNSHSIIYDSELEESSESLKNTSFDLKGSIQNDSSHVYNDSCSSKQDESHTFMCGTPFSDHLKKDFKVKSNIILDDELLDNGSCSSSLQRFSSS